LHNKKSLLSYIGIGFILAGCGMNHVDFKRFPEDMPLVVVSDGLFSTDARRFFRGLCEEENVPYCLADNVSWHVNKEAIEQAHGQGREIILVGYSAGCDQVRIASEYCRQKGIKVHIVYFDPTYLSLNPGRSIPNIAIDVISYRSEDIPDVMAIGKGREVRDYDLQSKDTKFQNRHLTGPHVGIFDNNRDVLKKEIRQLVVNNRRHK
jgi:hypothetical protein